MERWKHHFLVLFSILVGNIEGFRKKSSFSCKGRHPGYYADMELNCQAYHLCNRHGVGMIFECPEKTSFEQRSMVCNHESAVDCSISEKYYDSNLRIGNENSKLIEDSYHHKDARQFFHFPRRFHNSVRTKVVKSPRVPRVIIKKLPVTYFTPTSYYGPPNKNTFDPIFREEERLVSFERNQRRVEKMRPKDGARGGTTSARPKIESTKPRIRAPTPTPSPEDEGKFFFTTTPSTEESFNKPWKIEDIRKIFYIPNNIIE